MSIEINRQTKETNVSLKLDVNGDNSNIEISTGVGFFDHMLNQLAFYAGWSMNLKAQGDIEVDEHHLIEDVAICLGQAIAQYRQQGNIERFGQRLLPMDETLVMVAADVCGRGCAVINLNFTREMMGNIGTEMWPHFFKTLANQAGISLHINEQYSDNNHHLIEAAFKGLGMTLKQALNPIEQLKSTKGVLEP